MSASIEEIIEGHLSFEREQVHLLTTLYGIVAPQGSFEVHLEVAKCIELLKVSTLIMDDFLDKSPQRNGLPSVYAKEGPEQAVLIAEILKSSATIAFCDALSSMDDVSESDKLYCLTLFEDAYRAVCLGQLEEFRFVKSFLQNPQTVPSEASYWNIIENTTAALVASPLLIGGRLTHQSSSTIERLRSYGITLGLAYQVRDDIIDIIGLPEETGKVQGGDIREKKIRLPLIHLLNHGNARAVAAVHTIYSKDTVTQDDYDSLCELLNVAGSIDYARFKVEELCGQAMEIAGSMNNANLAQQLKDVAGLILFKEELELQATKNTEKKAKRL